MIRFTVRVIMRGKRIRARFNGITPSGSTSDSELSKLDSLVTKLTTRRKLLSHVNARTRMERNKQDKREPVARKLSFL